MLSIQNVRLQIIQPVLKSLNRYSLSAENLLIGIALHESKLTYLIQRRGPALGIYQMEPDTHEDLWVHYLKYNPARGARLWLWATRRDSAASYPDHSELIGNIYYATAAAREQLWRAPEALPAADDVQGLAEYWHKYWCRGCRGTVGQWIDSYRRFAG